MDYVIAGLFGLTIGSFLNVVILRFNDWISILKTRSRCPDCQTTLRWYDLVPLFSFLQLRGRCRYCQKPISWQYPVVELTTALLFIGGFYLIFIISDLTIWRAIFAAFGYGITIAALVVIFFHDLYEMLIVDSIAYVLIGAALIFALSYYGPTLSIIYGALVGFLPIALIVYPSRGKWMGEGDVKLSLGLGILLGWPSALVGLILAFLIGGLFGVVALVTKNAKLRTAVPFAPFLIIGALIALFYGPSLVNWYLGTIGYGYY